jgi:acyl-CoA reductase-like NAD-dependent aldehyde dehydrogenase
MSPSKVSTLEFEKFYNIIDGQQRGSDDIHHGVNPATGKELWDVPIGTEKDLNDAVAAGKKAFPSWRDTPIQKRKELLLKFADAFTQHAEDFTTLLCKESGKPVSNHSLPEGSIELTVPQRKFAAIEIGGVAGFIQYHC